ncbi:MAG: TorF family putative porin [Bdellovibrionota bacterium]|nr:TorF family putative porin [Bdellovibrionota bacterium]
MRLSLLSLLLLSISIPSYSAGSAGVAVTSEYVWRGVKQSNGAAVQAQMSHELIENLSVGIWTSTIDGGKSENDLSLNYALTLTEGHSMNFGAIGYLYVTGSKSNTLEANLGYSSPWFDLQVYNTSDYFGTETSSTYVNLGTQIPFHGNMNLKLNIGMTSFDDEVKSGVKNYSDYKIGIERSTKLGALEFFYTSTDRKTWDGSTETKQLDEVVGVSLAIDLD